MIETFVTSFKLKNTYRANSIIYSIKQLPIIKRILPNTLYKSRALKIIANIISILLEIVGVFLGKFLYVLLMIFLMLQLYKTNISDTFLHIFTFLTLAGALLNTYMFNPTKDKYYAMILMNMDAKKYTLSDYYYALIKIVVGFLPFTIIFGLMAGVPLWVTLLFPIFVIMAKLVKAAYCIKDFQKTRKVRSENTPTKIQWILIAIFVLAAYGLPAINFTINISIFLIIFTVALILGIYSFATIKNFNEYKKMYKQLLTESNMVVLNNQATTQIIKENNLKQIELDVNDTSNKSGFAYFHELFVKRHRKILTKAVKKQSFVISLILVVVIIGVLINDNFKETTNSLLLTYLPYFVFIMYLLNRGTTVTQAMFMNCDHSMLTYRIYRTPKVILGIFKERLKTLISINLLPAFIIAIGLPVLLYITGGTDNIYNYFSLFFSIIAMSIFFSVHYLVMYYLLQPYNVNTEMKSSTYRLVQGLTYFVSWYMIQIKLPTFQFGIAMVIFCVAYSLISLFIAYKYAPKTFKLRI